MHIKSYQKTHREGALRIWKEIGWTEDNFPDNKTIIGFIESGRTVVAEMNGEAEALATSLQGSISLGEKDLPFAGLASVNVGRAGRKSGAAGSITAQVIAEEAESGAAVAGLSMFEQGYYDRLGFGLGSYEKFASFDPARLKVPYPSRPPTRIGTDQTRQIHAARLNRMLPFSGIELFSPELTHLQMTKRKAGFGLGFYDGTANGSGGGTTDSPANGSGGGATDSPAEVPSHLLWIFPKGEYGPYSISFMAYQSWEQFIELLGVLRSLGDQVRLVEMVEPAPFNLQGLLDKPVRAQIVTKGGEFENITTAEAFQQVRILDLGQCISALSFPNTESVSFTLELADPIGGFLEDRDGWRGLSGTYTLTLGPVCELIEGLRTGENGALPLPDSAQHSKDGALPHMKAGIGALSRLLFGVLPASVLSAADKMEAPEELIERLDNLIRLPEPHFDWYF